LLAFSLTACRSPGISEKATRTKEVHYFATDEARAAEDDYFHIFIFGFRCFVFGNDCFVVALWVSAKTFRRLR
jgi:hypothetical protein